MSESHPLDVDSLSPVLRPWSSGRAVAELQELLRAHGFKVRIDGEFGWITEVAIKEFQHQHELKSNGIVDRATWAALKTLVLPGTRPLRPGCSGADVQEVQGLLQVYGYNLARDGIFGADTQRAVLNFQQQHYLNQTGIVDATTWSVLRGIPCAPPPVPDVTWLPGQRKWW